MISKIFLFFYDFIDNKFHMKPITSMINDLKIKNVFDVGAHRGEFSSSLLKNCPLVKKIYAFEPQTSIFNELKQKKK